MIPTGIHLLNNIVRLQQVPGIATLLELVCKSTEMSFAAAARVTGAIWLVYRAQDDLQFDLVVRGELKLETTICQQIRDPRQTVFIDNVQQNI